MRARTHTRINNNDITVKIGNDNQMKVMQDCTVITVPYNSCNGERGAIAVIGPTRMDYSRIYSIISYINLLINNKK